MRTLTAGQTTLLQGGDYDVHAIVEVEDSAGTYVDRTSDAIAVEWDQTTDELVNACTVEFRRNDGTAATFAPLMSATPPVDTMRGLRVSVATVAVGATPMAGDYEPVFDGAIDRVKWPQRFPGRVVAECRDTAGALMDHVIQEVRTYGSDAGVALETVMQQVLDDNGFSGITLYVPTATSAVVTPAYEQGKEPVMQALRTLAEAIGWTVRYRYIDSLSAWRLTLYEPDRDKAVTDFTFGVSQYYDVTAMEVGVEDIRNKIKVESPNTDGSRSSSGTPVSDSASITKYSPPGLTVERYMEIIEGSDSPIVGETKRAALANAALSDLAEPDAVVEIHGPLWWPGELGVDLYSITANSIHFSSNQTLAPTHLRNRIEVGDKSGKTHIGLRGKPTGGQLMWREREKRGEEIARTLPPAVLALKNFRETRVSASEVRYEWEPTNAVVEVWVYESEAAKPIASEPWPTSSTIPTHQYPRTTTTYTATVPSEGRKKFLQFEPRDDSNPPKAGEVRRATIDSLPGTRVEIERIYQSPGSSLSKTDLNCVITDPLGRAGVLYAWVNKASTDDADPTAEADGSVSLSGPGTVTSADTWNLTGGGTDALFDEIGVHSARAKRIFLEYVAEDGTTTGKVDFLLKNWLDLIDPDGELITDAIKYRTQFASTIRPPEVLAALPALPNADYPEGSLVTLVPGDGTVKLYRNEGGSWTAAIPTADLSGTIAAAQIADAAVTATKIATGAVEESKIGALAVTAAKIGAGAVETAKIANLAVTEAVVAAGAITESKIGAAAVTTAKLANLAVTDAILAAGAVTETKITDLSVSTTKLQAGAVTAAKITAGTITSNEIASLTVIAGNIAAGAIETDKLAANAVTAAKIAANTITASQIAAGTITTTEIASSTIVAGNIASGAITTGLLAAGAVTASKLAIQSHAVDGLTLTSNSPSAGSVAWSAHTISYNGTSYSIGAGSTSAEVIWLDVSASTTALQGSTRSAFETAFDPSAGDLLVATNSSGTADPHFNATYVTGGMIRSGVIVTDKLAANAVTAAKIATGTITANELAADSVTATKIAVGAVDADELAANAVTAGKIAAGAISTSALFVDGVVESAALATGAVIAGKIAAGAVTTAKLDASAVTAAKLAAINLEVGKYIRSTSYTAGSSGWSINAAGDAEFNNVTVRGTLDGVTGTFAGTVSATAVVASNDFTASNAVFTGTITSQANGGTTQFALQDAFGGGVTFVTSMQVGWLDTGPTQRLTQVEVGEVDSGGTGFRVLRVAN
jgi:hypothetical protein